MTRDATAPHEAPSRSLWFMGAHITIHLSRSESAAGVSMIEHAMAKDYHIPLHRHEEDETFYFLDGRFRFRLDETACEFGAGQSVHVPAGTVHAFRVVSDAGRFLTVTNGRFETMIRALSRPASSPALPPQVPVSAEEIERLAAVCAANGIEFVGPPID